MTKQTTSAVIGSLRVNCYWWYMCACYFFFKYSLVSSKMLSNVTKGNQHICLRHLNGARHAKMCLQGYAESESSDQLAHSRSLIRAFIIHFQNHWILQNEWMKNKRSDDICACAGRCKSTHFSWRSQTSKTQYATIVADRSKYGNAHCFALSFICPWENCKFCS